jgi:hypothetical protein
LGIAIENIQLWVVQTSRLALSLFVTRVVADNHDTTVATNDLALVANLLDAWVYLHVSFFCLGFKNRLLVAINDSTSGEVVSA